MGGFGFWGSGFEEEVRREKEERKASRFSSPQLNNHLVNHPPVAGVVADLDGALPLPQAQAIGHHGPVRLADPGESPTQRDEERADRRRR